jgi:hypothetical protein
VRRDEDSAIQITKMRDPRARIDDPARAIDDPATAIHDPASEIAVPNAAIRDPGTDNGRPVPRFAIRVSSSEIPE